MLPILEKKQIVQELEGDIIPMNWEYDDLEILKEKYKEYFSSDSKYQN